MATSTTTHAIQGPHDAEAHVPTSPRAADSEETLTMPLDRSEYNARPACFRTTVHEVICVIVLTMGVAQSSLSLGLCQVITKVIGIDLSMTQGEISWINAAAALTCGAFLMFCGGTADTFGRKRQLLAGFTAFTVSALIAGFAVNPIMFHTFRGVQGLAAAASIPAAIGILGALYDHESPRKNKAFAAFAAGNPLGFVVGSIMSGITTQILNWRCSFYLMAIIYAILTVLAWAVVPEDEDKVYWDHWRGLDIIGAAMVTIALVLICAVLTLAATAADGWRTPYILVCLCVGLALLGGFVFWESKIANPLMPLHIWKNLTFSMLMLVGTLGFMNFMITQFWISLYCQEIRHLSALLTAVWLLPQAVSGAIINAIAAFALGRVDNRFLLLAATAAFGASAVLFATQDAYSIYWAHAFPGLAVAVIGADLMYNVANMYVLSALPKAQQSTAGGMFNTILQLAQAIGLGISTAVFDAVVTGGQPTVGELMKGFSIVFWVAAGLAGGMLLVIPWVKVGKQGAIRKTLSIEAEHSDGLENHGREKNVPARSGSRHEKSASENTQCTIGSADTAVLPGGRGRGRQQGGGDLEEGTSFDITLRRERVMSSISAAGSVTTLHAGAENTHADDDVLPMPVLDREALFGGRQQRLFRLSGVSSATTLVGEDLGQPGPALKKELIFGRQRMSRLSGMTAASAPTLAANDSVPNLGNLVKSEKENKDREKPDGS